MKAAERRKSIAALLMASEHAISGGELSEKFDVSRQIIVQDISALRERGYEIGNIDATVIAQRPKLAPYVAKMRQNIAAAFGCASDAVNVKATTEEGLGFTGTGEAIAAHAVCLLSQK